MKLFQRQVRHALVLGLAIWPLHCARSDSGGVSLDHLMERLRSVHHVEARYLEHRTLHVLRTPIEARGTLRFDAPDRLEKMTDPAADGSVERLAINGDKLTIDRGRTAGSVVLMLSEHPEIGVLVESIRATLSGDGATLRRIFDITISGTIDHWQLVLQPRDPALREIVQWIRVSGYAERITAIDTQDNDGDHAEMSIVELGR